MAGDSIDSYLTEMRALVDEHGWAVQYVPATKESPPFAYTVGLSVPEQLPEVLVYGLPREVSHRLCSEAVARMRAAGAIEPHQPYAGLLSDFDAVFLPLDGAERIEELAICRRLWPQRAFDAVQLVWPDRENRFPWEEGCDPKVVAAQPLRGEPA